MRHYLLLLLLWSHPWLSFGQERPGPHATGTAPPLIRNLADTIGFAATHLQIEAVIQTAERLEASALEHHQKLAGNPPWIAGICPHDDHLLAGRVYVHLFQNFRARRYIIFGVAHRAWKWPAQDVLIFDQFDYWRGPYGLVKVSGLREELLTELPSADVVIQNDWQAEEHSIEGIIPVLQYYQPDLELVPILVPYMNWQTIERLSEHLANALAKIIPRHHWQLGTDVAFIFSNDGDHYGDQDWGGKNLAPFGATEAGYRQATQQDSALIRSTLTGLVTAEKLAAFCKRVWGENDIKEYQIRWCGRFAIPFGLNTVQRLRTLLQQPALSGELLRYDTSYHLGQLPLDHPGIGVTAPFNLHHWVGYSAIGYR
ncbi:AmmeMemoRadiSam system protein B [candidate division KSB1 bacterium]|nr:AmmeMemoRadiSam system protein B [candidate division KSB1 bacterium]